jgi:hypothetical protein
MGDFDAITGIPDGVDNYGSMNTMNIPTTCCRHVEYNGTVFPVLATLRIISPNREASIVIHRINESTKYCVHMLDRKQCYAMIAGGVGIRKNVDDIKAVIADIESPQLIFGPYGNVCQEDSNYCEKNSEQFSRLVRIFGLDRLDDLEGNIK